MNIYIQHINSIALPNKYTKWYINLIISKSKLRRYKNKYEYFENHHILPKSLSGADLKENYILLTAREHFILHILLTKMFYGDNKFKMLCAFDYMSKIKNISSRLYSSIKQERSKIDSIKFSGTGNPNFGKKHSNETKIKISQTHTGIKESDETKLKLSKLKSGKKLSQSHCENISKGKKGKPYPIDGIIKRRKTILANGGRSGERAFRAKKYICISPEGIKFNIQGTIQSFCVEHNLNYSNICKYYMNKGKILKCQNKKYLGWEFIMLDKLPT